MSIRSWLQQPTWPAPDFRPPETLASLTAAARVVDMSKERVVPTNESWQKEAWDFYDTLGEFRYAVDWRAEMISRIRLRAAKIKPGQDEPEVVDIGPAADLIAALEEGTQGGRAQLMRGFATQLGVPGECWLTGEEKDGKEAWRIRSTDEIRESTGKGSTGGKRAWQVLDDTRPSSSSDRWIALEGEVFVTRVWDPHARFFHKADSPARAARPVMRELELVNRHIQAQYLSRLATAGILIINSDVTFPVRPEFADLPDPLMAELIEVVRTAIQNPGTAAAVIPILMRAPLEDVEKAFQFIDLTVKADEKILEKRESAIRRLATQLDLPAEVLLGMGDVNHWSAWQLEESGIKVHILPMVERICNALTTGYLRPRLKAAEENPEDWVVWYDASEITMRPDRSEAAQKAHDDFAINDTAYLRETGFDEADIPDDEELTFMILRNLAKDPASALTALKALTGEEVEPVSTTPESEEQEPQESPEVTGQNGPPETEGEPPPAPDQEKMAAELRRHVQTLQDSQKGMPHWLVKDIHGSRITHPRECQDLPVQCPYHAGLDPAVVIPGRSGTYEISIRNGRLAVGALRVDSTHAHTGS